MSDAPEATEDRFFAALLTGDAAALDGVLTDDFLIIDVMAGSLVARAPFVAAIADGVLGFSRVDVVERQTRRYGDAAVIVGRTAMEGTFVGAPFAVASRYTHVLVSDGEAWRLASAQGTAIGDAQ
jgi:ketosteroid isomerase-like protein